jgi:prolyl oligopeptidase
VSKVAKEYPETRIDDVIEEVHGVMITDPYRWLENSSDKKVLDWIEIQRELTKSIMDEYNGWDQAYARVKKLLSFDSILPYSLKVSETSSGPRFFFLMREMGKMQYSLYYQDGNKGDRIKLINTDELSSAGLVAIDWYFPSMDGRLIAYGLSESGTEKSVLHIIDVEKKRTFSEKIPQTRMCSLVWLPDSSSFYYTRYPLHGTVSPEEENYNRHIYFHRLGDDYKNDLKVFGEGTQSNSILWMASNDDCTALSVMEYLGITSDIHISVVNPDDPLSLGFLPLIRNESALSVPLIDGTRLYILTQIDAPNGKVIMYDLKDFLQGGNITDPKTVVEEDENVITPDLDRFVILRDSIGVMKEQNAMSKICFYDSETGHLVENVNFDTPMTVKGIYSLKDSDGIYFMAESFINPISIYYQEPKNETELLFGSSVELGSESINVRQEWYRSRDGIKVSMFVINHKNIETSSTTPVLLTGYGGFGFSITPQYTPDFCAWIENGGVVAIPNLRGGNEYGQKWHRAGNRENKQNVFDDFIAAAEWLIDNDIGSQETLGILGGSNGGLLVGAALVQRPDLFKCVYCSLPLLDMIRYTQFQVAKLWIPEYGDPEIKEEFRWLYAYSPYHNVASGIRYPTVFFKTALGDSRVDPMHALKMTAKLQNVTHAPIEERPILLWVESEEGHSVGRSLEQEIEGKARFLVFFANHTGLTLK